MLLLKTNLPEFQKDTYHAYIHSIHRFLPQTHTSLKSHLIFTVTGLKGWIWESKVGIISRQGFSWLDIPEGCSRSGQSTGIFLNLCHNSNHVPAVLSVIQEINYLFFFWPEFIKHNTRTQLYIICIKVKGQLRKMLSSHLLKSFSKAISFAIQYDRKGQPWNKMPSQHYKILTSKTAKWEDTKL